MCRSPVKNLESAFSDGQALGPGRDVVGVLLAKLRDFGEREWGDLHQDLKQF